MASTLKNLIGRVIDNTVRNNENHEITGSKLHDILMSLLNILPSSRNGSLIITDEASGALTAPIYYDGGNLLNGESSRLLFKEGHFVSGVTIGNKFNAGALYMTDERDPSTLYKITVVDGNLIVERQ